MTRVLLLNTYEQGHQPLGLAAPAALLRADGHDVRTLDLSVEPADESGYEWADLIAVSTPMHTAARLGLALSRQLEQRGLGDKVVLYGLGAMGIPGRTLTGDTDGQLLALARGDAPAGIEFRPRRRAPCPIAPGFPR